MFQRDTYTGVLATAKSRLEKQNKILNEQADKALCQYIDCADNLRISIQETLLVNTANSILRNRYTGDSFFRTLSKI